MIKINVNLLNIICSIFHCICFMIVILSDSEPVKSATIGFQVANVCIQIAMIIAYFISDNKSN